MKALLILSLGLTIASSEKCYPLYLSDRWYIGRINRGGLCNMLFSVYGQVPLALLLNSSLILSEMYSRHSFTDKWESVAGNPIFLQFSTFYDIHKFATYWKQRSNLTIIEVPNQETCLGNNRIHDITFNGVRWCPGDSDCGVMTKVELSGISLPLDNSVNFIRVSPDICVWRFYNFWQSNQHLQLLQAVHQSLHPAKLIQERVKSVDNHFRHLNLSYWAVHLRLEPDVAFESDENDSDFRILLEEQRQFILDSKCYRNSLVQNKSLPGIHASSGIFQYNDHHHDVLFRRAVLAVKMLREIGFTTIHHGHYDEAILPEHQALADLYISRQAECFIPCYMRSPKASSFSYLAVRFRQLDAVKDLRMENRADIKQEYEPGYNEFHEWGI